MATFYYQDNGDTRSVIRKDHARLYTQCTWAGGHPVNAGVRIFTFSDWLNPQRRLLLTGTLGNLEKLIEIGGHSLRPNTPNSGWEGGVLFCGDFEFSIREQLQYVTTLQDILQVFGLSLVPSIGVGVA